ncbi:acetylcholine receptor subunit alpha-1-B-like [Ruditapes philippinarum]|uniref:acetylcholine receptor subunit alpha-1-B-like n=1 Tax=Ruditapes philippinarum TaxID=129788 RepID=UPI00295B9A27|nr:acetylcholine receptor subunit alpha-1-B-like [Ruditapes philippinarum]
MDKNIGVSTVLILALNLVIVSSRNRNTSEATLHKKLFKDYNQNVIPRESESLPIEVTLDMVLMSIDNINEKRQTISIKAFLEIKWRDSFLTWDAKEYSGVSKISVKNTDIWIPDVALQDTYDKLTDLGQIDGKANILSDGLVTIWPYKIYTIACKVSIGKFPFDKQICTFDFLSWSHSTSTLVLKSTQDTPDMSVFAESGEWDLTGSRVKVERRMYGNDSWDHVLFRFDLQRKSLYNVLNVILPVFCISVLNIVSFILPSESGERVTFSISIFLSLAVFLTTINSSMPESSDEVASFSVYVGLQLFGSACTIMITIVSLSLFHREKNTVISSIFKALVRFCCITKSNEHYRVRKDETNDNVKACLNETVQDSVTFNYGCTRSLILNKTQHLMFHWVALIRRFFLRSKCR